MNRIAHPMVAFLAVVGLSALVGCAHPETTRSVVPTSEPVAVTQTSSYVAKGPDSAIHVSDAILKACQIDLDNVDTAPKFDFDRADLRPEERNLLATVAKCVTTGPLHGRALHLIGRADPRGEVEYNFVLGESRAGSVSAYLRAAGVSSSKVTTTSRGKLDASGTDAATWQRDRRVDIDLQ